MPEYAFDGLVGPTHHYAGLSHGNLASSKHRGQLGNPRAAALQGLAKMQEVASLSPFQALLPPHERPYVPVLRRLGFSGRDADVLEAAYRYDPALLSAVSSASSMWAANAATVTPGADSGDALTHLTPANLASMFHRSLEAPTTTRILRAIFASTAHFCVHDALPSQSALADEGAANHTLLATSRAHVHLFGWGRTPDATLAAPTRFTARQALAASQAVVRLHGIGLAQQLLWQQDPAGIDAGAFHSDVLAVGSGSLFLMHERAFLDSGALVRELQQRLGDELCVVMATEHELPLAEAVASYVFNSQLLPLRDGRFQLVAPREAESCVSARAYLERVQSATELLAGVTYVNVNDSMRNGGGPACLRLRVPLQTAEAGSIAANVFWSADLGTALESWVHRHYRDRLDADSLRDPLLLEESRRALQELTDLLRLGPIYDFQRA
ncbi:MAG TPA: N-succinylarginine dihydrolase [Polyangiaceae bacterium]|nr:N-succinylarginine dihydrolase [Polyangiaceae bacterium]